MYRLQYGIVVLDVTTINNYEERVLSTDDGADALMTRIQFSCSSVWSPWTQGLYQDAGVDVPQAAAATKATLRRLLGEKRRQLVLSIPDHTGADPTSRHNLVVSPLFNPANGQPFPCDANNGPVVEVQEIREMKGEMTMVVDLKVTTWINEASAVRRVLSNRWTMVEELDPCFWSRKIIAGKTYFRADAMRVVNAAGLVTTLSPDQFAESVMPPVPNGFQRRAIRREVGSDGLSLTWQVVDDQCALMPVNRKIARIHGHYGDSYTPGNIGQVLTRGTQLFKSVAAHAAREAHGSPIGTGLLTATDVALAFIEPGVFPFNVIELYLRVDGRPDATREDLVNALARAAAGTPFQGTTFAQAAQSSFIYTNDLRVGLDDDAMWAEYTFRYRGLLPSSSGLGVIGLAPRANVKPIICVAGPSGAIPPPDQNGLGDPTLPNNTGMVAVAPNPAGSPRGAAGSGTPPSDNDPTRNGIATAFLRPADVKGTEDAAKQITSMSSQRTDIAPGDVKQLAGS